MSNNQTLSLNYDELNLILESLYTRKSAIEDELKDSELSDKLKKVVENGIEEHEKLILYIKDKRDRSAQ